LKLLLLFTLLLPVFLFGQNRIIKGHILSENGLAISQVKVVGVSDLETQGTYTDSMGFFKLQFNEELGDSIQLRLKAAGQENQVLIVSTKVQSLVLLYNQSSIGEVTIYGNESSSLDLIEIPDPQTMPVTDFGNIIKTFIAVSTGNELTSNYNVRGGNFDENVIYVNDIEIYKPFLGRSGQQEGMSFIYGALVDNVHFSAGGFSSMYQDKMSSVLDIKYKTPELGYSGGANVSLLGAQGYASLKPNEKIDFLLGARYRTNSYYFRSLDVDGSYNPQFYDVQGIFNYKMSKEWSLQVLSHFASNKYEIIPQTSQVAFGTINQPLEFNIYYDGREISQYQTTTNAINFKYKPNNEYKHNFILSSFISNESETFDVQGQFYLNNIETDFDSENVGDSSSNLGIGTFLEHARNFLNAKVISFTYRGQFDVSRDMYNSTWKWGTTYKHEIFDGRLSEWQMIDSAGYSIPKKPDDQIQLNNVIKARHFIVNDKVSAYVENTLHFPISRKKEITYKEKVKDSKKKIKKDTTFNTLRTVNLSIGGRAGYWDYSNDLWITPRLKLKFTPASYIKHKGKILRRNINFFISTGLFYQPPFYREIFNLQGELNPNIKSQKSVHAIIGMDYSFSISNQDFKFVAEAYYKYLWDVNPYKIENTNINYFANNDVVAYATGIDATLNGEFIPGVQSWLKLGFLTTKERNDNESYNKYYNSSGEIVAAGSSEIADTVLTPAGFIPRPSNQNFNIGVTFEDEMPKFTAMKLKLGLMFISGFPHGPPSNFRYTDTLKSKSYFRVNIGFGLDFLDIKNKKKNKEWKNSKFLKPFSTFYFAIEIFNLFNFKNVISYDWITSAGGQQYAIPNYLTQTTINLKLVAAFKTKKPGNKKQK
jgi:hypothetical protein